MSNDTRSYLEAWAYFDVKVEVMLLDKCIQRLLDCSRCEAELLKEINIKRIRGVYELWTVGFNCKNCGKEHIVWNRESPKDWSPRTGK